MNRTTRFQIQRPALPARRHGLSLVEVAIALAIFVIGAIALLRIFPPGLTVIEDSGKRLTGSRMADNLLTRYDSEPLSIPDAIFDAHFDNGAWQWQDYPGAMLPARSKGQSLPRSLDQLDDSALGHLRFVRGEGHEIQGPFASDGGLVRVLSSFVIDRARADVYREAAVQNVGLSANGELDFSGATYKQSGRGDRAISTFSGVVSGDGVTAFHEPIIELANSNQALNLDEGPITNTLTGANYTLILQLQDMPGVSNRAAFYGGYVNQNHPTASFTVATPSATLHGATMGSPLLLGLGSDFSVSGQSGQAVEPNTAYPLVFDSNGQASIGVNIVNDVMPENDEYFYVLVNNAKGCSVRQSRFLCRIPGNDDPGTGMFGPGTPTDPTAAPPLVAVRPPLDVRATSVNGVAHSVVYQASYNWQGGGARNEPLVFPPTDGDADYPQSCDYWDSANGPRPGRVDRAYWSQTSADPQIEARPINLRFRQFLGAQPVANGTSVDLTGLQVPDIYAPGNPAARAYPVSELKNVWIDYNVYDWRYLSENVTQFATPFPGSKQNYPLILGPMFGFQDTADLREVRLPVGGLLGPVYTINVYQQPGNQPSFAARTLDYRTVSGPAQRAALKHLFKEGRLLTSIRDSGPSAQFQFSAYYRTADGWAQQIGAVASRYLPWRDPAQYGSHSVLRAQISQPWREYFLASDGKLYFHPSEAGKSVLVQTATDGSPYSQFAIDDNIIACPGNVPAAFAPSGKVVASGVVGTQIYDVAAPDVGLPTTDPATQTRGRGGLLGRSAWTNGEVYQQQFAP